MCSDNGKRCISRRCLYAHPRSGRVCKKATAKDASFAVVSAHTLGQGRMCRKSTAKGEPFAVVSAHTFSGRIAHLLLIYMFLVKTIQCAEIKFLCYIDNIYIKLLRMTSTLRIRIKNSNPVPQCSKKFQKPVFTMLTYGKSKIIKI